MLKSIYKYQNSKRTKRRSDS